MRESSRQSGASSSHPSPSPSPSADDRIAQSMADYIERNSSQQAPGALVAGGGEDLKVENSEEGHSASPLSSPRSTTTALDFIPDSDVDEENKEGEQVIDVGYGSVSPAHREAAGPEVKAIADVEEEGVEMREGDEARFHRTESATSATNVKPEIGAGDVGEGEDQSLSHSDGDVKESSSRSDAPGPDVKPVITSIHETKPQREKPGVLELDIAGLEPVLSLTEETFDPDAVMAKVKVFVNNLDILLRESNFGPADSHRRDFWKKEVVKLKVKISEKPQILKSKVTSLQILIAVLGSTGAGKSSLVNALLDCDSLVPTNSSRACTAVVTEISYNYQDDGFRAEVEFLTVEEWRAELVHLRRDLINEETGKCFTSVDGATEAVTAWHCIHALYPQLHQNDEPVSQSPLLSHSYLIGPITFVTLLRLYSFAQHSVDQLLQLLDLGDQKSPLGTTIHLSAATSSDMGQQLGQYIDSKEHDVEAVEFWPIIKRVKLFVKADALSTGSVIVDLPGVAESNEARGKIARGYQKKAKMTWIVAPQTRAGDEKIANDLFDASLTRQLQMDGVFDRVTFITTKADDFSKEHVFRSFPKLKKEMEVSGDDLDDRHSQEKKKAVKYSRMAKAAYDTAVEEVKGAKALLKGWDGRLSTVEKDGSICVSDRDQRSKNYRTMRHFEKTDAVLTDCDSSDSEAECPGDSDEESDDERTETLLMLQDVEEIVKKKAEVLEALEMARWELKTASERATQKVTEMPTTFAREKKEFAAFEKRRCAMARNATTREVLSERFREVLGRLAIEEQVQAKKYGLATAPPRAYAIINLPVFCISATEYAKLTYLAGDDGEATVFSTLKETGVPALRQHCKNLTLKPRYAYAIALLRATQDLLLSVRVALSNNGSNAEDAESVRLAYDKEIGNFERRLSTLASEGKRSAAGAFADLRKRLAEGEEDARVKAVGIMQCVFPVVLGAYRLSIVSDTGNTTNFTGAPTVTAEIAKEFAHATDGVVELLRKNFSLLWEEKGVPDLRTLALRNAVLLKVNVELESVGTNLHTAETGHTPTYEINIDAIDGADDEDSLAIINRGREACKARKEARQIERKRKREAEVAARTDKKKKKVVDAE
ncbi:hypothetical protein P7C70_g7669, partial [Phenoliferia sp. Uapishka_3]